MRSSFPAASCQLLAGKILFFGALNREFINHNQFYYIANTLFFIIPEPPDLNTRMICPFLGLPFFLYIYFIAILFTPITFIFSDLYF